MLVSDYNYNLPEKNIAIRPPKVRGTTRLLVLNRATGEITDSKYANLEYEVLKYNEEINLSVVKVHLHTGRHHQIRVQFSSRDHSIYGDQKYGGRGHGKQIALWAYNLSFYHPITREKMTFSVLPEINGTWKILEDVKLK